MKQVRCAFGVTCTDHNMDTLQITLKQRSLLGRPFKPKLLFTLCLHS